MVDFKLIVKIYMLRLTMRERARETRRERDIDIDIFLRTLIAQEGGTAQLNVERYLYSVLRAPKAIGTLPDNHSPNQRR